MKDFVVVHGEFQGQPMFRIYKNQEDADKAADGERVFPAFACGTKKVEVVFHFLPAMLKFALENKLQVPDKVLKAIKALGGK
jgi:hypothetical protein